MSRTDQLSKCLETGWRVRLDLYAGQPEQVSGYRAGEVDSSVPQIATEELRIALRLQTLVRQIIRATLEHERELEQLWKLTNLNAEKMRLYHFLIFCPLLTVLSE